MKILINSLKITALVALMASLFSCKDEPDFIYTYEVAGFDNMPAAMVAADVYGDNLYGKGYYWLDEATGLGSKPIDDQFYSGGTAVSKFADVDLTGIPSTDWYKYQMAVRFENSLGRPGYMDSPNCLVSFGYSDPAGWLYAPLINFTDSDTTTRVIEGLYICNTSYAYAQMTTDLGSGVPMCEESGGHVKVIFTGYDAKGVVTGKVEEYLANFEKKSGYYLGILQGWKPVTLATLGRIHSLSIDIESTDMGAYGMNTPAYVAIDDIVVRFDKGTTAKANKDNILTMKDLK